MEINLNCIFWPVPGPPSDFKTYAFGEYIFVTWKPPQDPNGIITSYQVGSKEYSGSVVGKAPVSMETVQPDVFEKLLSKLAFEKSYMVEVRAQTSKGWGESARQIVTTVKRSGEFRTFKLYQCFSLTPLSGWPSDWLEVGLPERLSTWLIEWIHDSVACVRMIEWTTESLTNGLTDKAVLVWVTD